jgi:hypothetical protein
MLTEVDRYGSGVSIGLTQPDIILPSQHFPPRRMQAPEQRLMIAVLHDALDCVEKYRFTTNNRGRRLFYDAQQWLLAEKTDWPYSFECICAVLDLDANAVRRALRLPERQSALVSRQVKKALHNQADLKGVNVAVKNRMARLTGTGPTGMRRLEGAVVARSTPGVCSVHDDLRVTD